MNNFTYKILPFSDWGPNITKTGNYDFNCVTYSALDTPQTPLRLHHTNSNNINDSWSLNDPEIDALIEESERLVDREANIAKVKEVQLELLKRYSHASQIYTPIVRPLQWAYLKNWWEGSGAKTWLVHSNYQTGAWVDE
jgi:ABC-type transport system substrate-binding protein